MRIAVLVLCHKNPDQLALLVNRLRTHFDVYLHLDQKMKYDSQLFANDQNVFIQSKYAINWGSYNQICATFDLFRTAHQKLYDYYLFISGQDMPIKSNDEILSFFEKNSEVSFIDFEALPKAGWRNQGGGFDRIQYYWGNNYKPDLVSQTKKKALATVRMIQKKFNWRRKLSGAQYYGGWNWLNINAEAMNYLMDFVKTNPNYLKSFQYTHCADEIWVQTILANSDCAMVNDNLRFVSWADPTDEHPKILTMDDLNAIMQAKALFARKFDTGVDCHVIKEIYSLTAC